MNKIIKILFLSANPKDTVRLRLDQEVREIEHKILLAQGKESFKLINKGAVRVNDLQFYLNQETPDIVHFSGHGTEEGKIIFEDNLGNSKPVPPDVLARVFKILKDNIRCVLLNACYSIEQAKAISKYIDCVIGMSTEIGDDTAINFAAAFYLAIASERSLRNAFEQGINEILLLDLPEAHTPKILCRNGVNLSKIFLLKRKQTEKKDKVRSVKLDKQKKIENQFNGDALRLSKSLIEKEKSIFFLKNEVMYLKKIAKNEQNTKLRADTYKTIEFAEKRIRSLTISKLFRLSLSTDENKSRKAIEELKKLRSKPFDIDKGLFFFPDPSLFERDKILVDIGLFAIKQKHLNYLNIVYNLIEKPWRKYQLKSFELKLSKKTKYLYINASEIIKEIKPFLNFNILTEGFRKLNAISDIAKNLATVLKRHEILDMIQCISNHRHKNMVICNICSELSKAEKTNDFFFYINKISDLDLRFNAIIDAHTHFAYSEKSEISKKLWNIAYEASMKSGDSKDIALLAEKTYLFGEKIKATDLFNKAISIAKNTPEKHNGALNARSADLKVISENLANCGLIKKSLEVIKSISNQYNDRDEALHFLINIEAQNKKIADCEKYIKKIRSWEIRARATADLADKIYNIDNSEESKILWNQAIEICEDAIKSHINDEEMQKKADFILENILHDMLKNDEFDLALKLYNSIKTDIAKKRSLRAIVKHLAYRGDFKRAFNFGSNFKDDFWRGEIFSAIVSGLLNSGKLQRAYKLAIKGPSSSGTIESLVAITRSCIEKKKFDVAFDTINWAINILDKFTINSHFANLELGGLSIDLAKMGKYDLSLLIATNIKVN